MYYIAFTTINMPFLLDDYVKNLKKFGYENEVGFIITGDLKTPPEVKDYAQKISKQGVECLYFSVEDQKKWLQPYHKLADIVPYNSGNRRNIGYLMALQRGAEMIIDIDDDNFIGEEDFIGPHKIVGQVQEFPAISSSTGWYNICSMMDTEPPHIIYPRGYPYSKRWIDEVITTKKCRGRIVMNAGLWLVDPDVDAVTRLNQDVKTTSLKNPRIFLSADTWSPINTQNTAFHRDTIPCFYFVIMGESIKGLNIDRYGDIWAGYFARKVIDRMGDYVSYGLPLTIHKRNKHNILKDLQHEFWGMLYTESLVEIVNEISLTKRDYSSLYVELADAIERIVTQSNKYDSDMVNYFKKITRNMRIWVDACNQVSK